MDSASCSTSREWQTPEEMWTSVDMEQPPTPDPRQVGCAKVPLSCAAACARGIRREKRMFRIDPCVLIAPLLVFLLCAVGGIGGSLVISDEEAAARRAAAQGVLAAAASALTTSLVAAAAPAVAFSGVIRADPAWSAVAPLFRSVGAELAADVRASAAVITFVLAPQAVVREIAPPGLPGWAQVVSLDLLANATWRPGALAAIAHHNELVATGPQQLRAGPIGVVVRYSLWIDGAGPGETWGAPGGAAHECGAACHVNSSARPSSFWGFVQLNLDWARLLATSRIAETLCGAYAARIEYVRPGEASSEAVFACGGGEALESDAASVSAAVVALHNTWTLRAGPLSGSWSPWWRTPLTGAILVVSAILAVLLHSALLRRALYTALLHSILPARVVKSLVRGETYVECAPGGGATVLFVDIVGYTVFAAARSPAAVISALSDLYHAFDTLALRHGCFKVETVGDAFLVVTGLEAGEPAEAAAARAAAFALDLVALVPRLRLGAAGERVRVRVGLASGPLVAGVVGFRTPHFCVFGDTVNTAARMESHGEAGRIHLAPSTAALLEATRAFELCPRGEIDVKGKGRVATMWLVGRRDSSGSTARSGDGSVDGCAHGQAAAPATEAVGAPSADSRLALAEVPGDGDGLRLRRLHSLREHHDGWDLAALMKGDDGGGGDGPEPYDLRLFR